MAVGLMMATFGYSAGFVLASIIALLTIPILSKFDMSAI